MRGVAAFASLVSASRVAPDARRLILVRHGAVDRERADPPIKAGGFCEPPPAETAVRCCMHRAHITVVDAGA